MPEHEERRDRRAPAIFLDRDGTLIEEGELVERPDQIVLLPGAAEAIRRLRAQGYRIVVVTNQSAIARGLLDRDGLARVHHALAERLKALGAPLDAIYFSAARPDPEAERSQPLARRKPGAGMLIQAAAEHGLLLAQSWMIGDQPRDGLAGRRAGCRGSLLVRTGRRPLPADALDYADGLFDDLASAAQFVLDQGLETSAAAGQRSTDPSA